MDGDALFELNETFFVNLTNAQFATVPLAQGWGLIINDDQIVQFSVGGYPINENAGFAIYSVVRRGSSTAAASVDYSIGSGGTADYTPVSGTLTFAPGNTTPKTFTVPLLNDTIPEPNETVVLSPGNPVGVMLGSATTANLIIVNDNTLLQMHFHIAASGQWQQRQKPGCGRCHPHRQYRFGSQCRLRSGGGTTTSGGDYPATKGTISFAAYDIAPKPSLSVSSMTTG